jgi:hypothetical protein
MAKRIQKIPISMRALIARINRKLKPEWKMLCASRGARAQQELGDYHVVNFHQNVIVDDHVDPEDLGRGLGVMRRYERIIEK